MIFSPTKSKKDSTNIIARKKIIIIGQFEIYISSIYAVKTCGR